MQKKVGKRREEGCVFCSLCVFVFVSIFLFQNFFLKDFCRLSSQSVHARVLHLF